VPAGTPCQLDISNLTTTGWAWRFTRRPAASFAALSPPSARNPTFVPDVPDLFVVRLFATNAAGQVVAIGSMELRAFLELKVSQGVASRQPTLTLHSAAGHPCELLVSTNLTHWMSLMDLTNLTGTDTLLDPAGKRPCCFYRLRQK